MTVDSFIARMRTSQAGLFDTTVTVTRTAAAGAFNETTASYAAPTATTVYSGPGLVRPDRNTTVAEDGRSVELEGFVVKVPIDTAVRVGDVIQVTASTHDAGLAGLGLRVTDVQPDEWQICRRAFCVEQVARPT